MRPSDGRKALKDRPQELSLQSPLTILEERQSIGCNIANSSSTRQAAKILGLGSSTLARYIAGGKVPAPKVVQVGDKTVHIWTSRDIEKVRKLLPNIKDGRTTRHPKQMRKGTMPTS